MGLVKTRRLAAMRKQTTYAKASSFALRATEDKPVVGQRAIHLCRGYGGLKAGMEPPAKKGGGVAYLRKARGSGEMPESRHSVSIRPGG